MTYQNYERIGQKLGTFLENKVFKRTKFSKKIIKVGLIVQYSSEKNIFGTIQPIFNTEKDFENQDFEMFERLFIIFG